LLKNAENTVTGLKPKKLKNQGITRGNRWGELIVNFRTFLGQTSVAPLIQQLPQLAA
jgi:hypothetical protein